MDNYSKYQATPETGFLLRQFQGIMKLSTPKSGFGALYMKKNYKILLLVALLISGFILANKFAGGFFKNTTYKITAPIQKVIWKAGDWISDSLAIPFYLDNLKQENQRLFSQNLFFRQEVLSLKSLRDENERLKAVLKITNEQKFQLFSVGVLARDPQGNFLVIDKGKKHGLTESLAVITANGALVGRIEKAFDDFSQVLLITAQKSSFDVEIQDKESILAVAKGGEGQNLLFQLAPQDAIIKNSDLVKTATLGGKFPKGIIVGEVIECWGGDVSSFKQGLIYPYFLKSDLNQLFVITNFAAPRLSNP